MMTESAGTSGLETTESQAQRISHDDQIREAHGRGTQQRIEETQCSKGNADRVVEESPKQVLLDVAKRCTRELHRVSNST